MAESESGADKSEEPTSKRLEEARQKGQIARSKELGTLAVTFGGAAALLIFGAEIGRAMLDLMQGNFALSREVLLDEGSMARYLLRTGMEALLALQPFFIVMLIASIIGPVAVGGWLFSGEALQPKFSRMNPLQGIKRMFSAHALVELLKALAKFIIILMVALAVLKADQDDLLAIANESVESAILHSMLVTGWSLLWMACGLILIAAVDVPFQLWDSKQKLMMTKQEVKDEYKDSEGKPEVKGKIRQLQYEMANRRMMAEVPKADVVVTNPTHYSVALKYDKSKPGSSPVVVAKGIDDIAMKIREIAREYKVPMVASPALTRALYHTTKLDQEIPEGLFVAVAQVLAYVYQLQAYRKGKGEAPRRLPPELPIPDDLKH